MCNTIGGTTVYQERIQGHLVPCISQFAAAAGKDSLLKPLNYQLLLKTRESNTQVRICLFDVSLFLLERGKCRCTSLKHTIHPLGNFKCCEITSGSPETLAIKII